jgi:hypothetical protein
MKASFNKNNLKGGLKETIVGFILVGGGLYHLFFNQGDMVVSFGLIAMGGIALGLKLTPNSK